MTSIDGIFERKKGMPGMREHIPKKIATTTTTVIIARYLQLESMRPYS